MQKLVLERLRGTFLEVSILYLRCCSMATTVFNFAKLLEEIVSILYLRCPTHL